MACYYNTNDLEQYLYFFVKAQRDKLQPVLDFPLSILPSTNTNAYMDNDDIVVRRFKVQNLTYNEDASLDGRFRYEKRVEFTMSGYVPASTFFMYGYVAFKNSFGMTLFPNYDFPYQISYVYDGFVTRYTLTILSNIPLLRTRRYGQMTLRKSSTPCAYAIGDGQPTSVKIIGSKTYTCNQIANFQFSANYNEATAQVSVNLSWDMPINGLSDYYDASIEPILPKTIEVRMPNNTLTINYAVGSYSIENETVSFEFSSLSNEEPTVV